MLDRKKILILFISSVILYYILVTPTILPRVTVCPIDALGITVFVIISSLIIRYLSMLEAKELEDKIAAQYALMSTIINSTSIVMYLKELDGRIRLSNNKHADLVGLRPEEIVGLSTKDLYENFEIHEEDDRKIIETKLPIRTEKFVQVINQPEGHWYRITKAPVFNRFHQVINIVVIFENIDEEKELDERKKTFIATMTHDLKTPTLAQINALDLLLNNYFGELSTPQRDILKQIKSSCNYMSDLIFTILDTYLYDNGSIKLKLDKFDLEELLNETTGQMSNLFLDKKQVVKIHSSASSTTIEADKFQIKRVILNLLSNANSYGYPDSDIDIYIKDTNNSSSILFDIVNKSSYIPNEALSDVFAKFKQAKYAKFRKTGTGLGLYLSKQIIDAHGGEIHASSDQANETSTFGFSIPKTQSDKSQLMINND